MKKYFDKSTIRNNYNWNNKKVESFGYNFYYEEKRLKKAHRKEIERFFNENILPIEKNKNWWDSLDIIHKEEIKDLYYYEITLCSISIKSEFIVEDFIKMIKEKYPGNLAKRRSFTIGEIIYG